VARACSICSHPLRADVDAAISEPGAAIARVASDFAVSPDALKRHRANHILPERREALRTDPELGAVDPLKEMRTLYHRMIEHLERVEQEPDNWQAILAFHREARRDLELVAKLMGDLDERPQVNILIAPAALTVIVEALAPYPDARAAVVDALAPLEATSS
jgi:transposase-like protein